MRHDPKSPGKYFHTPSSILIAICKIYGQVYLKTWYYLRFFPPLTRGEKTKMSLF
ncbi:MAG: hypothetical protein LBR79_00685 [Oscillospiraceae bacterium]|nr:hypothetical protein [Oscillospiraceae bacterium]